MKHTKFLSGGFCPEGFCLGGFRSGGFLFGGLCPVVFDCGVCPRTPHNIKIDNEALVMVISSNSVALLELYWALAPIVHVVDTLINDRMSKNSSQSSYY